MAVRIPMTRSATDPLSLSHIPMALSHSSQECTEEPLVQQEQAMEASSEVHVSSSHTSMHKGYSQMTSTLRHKMHSTMSQPSTSHGSQDRFISSSSANVSRESSFRSTSRPGSQQTYITQTAMQMAQLAMGIASRLSSQETLSDQWYRSSNSLSSVASSSQAHTFSDTSPFLSESEPEQFQTKKFSQSFHSSHAPRSVKQRRPSAPPRYRLRGEDNTPDFPSRSSRHPIRQQSDDEVHVFDPDSVNTPTRREEVSCGAEGACEASNNTFRKQEIYAAPLRTKTSRKVFGNVEQSENQSRISDATPRQSMISEATSEGTITSPRTSIYGKGIGLHCANG